MLISGYYITLLSIQHDLDATIVKGHSYIS